MARRSGKRITDPDGVRVHGKNANGTGSVYRDGDRWVATWRVPGEKRPRKATGRTQHDAIRRREERRSQTAPTSADLSTVAQLADWWLNNTYRHAVAIDTWHKARERLPRIKATLGHQRIDQVVYGVIVEWQAQMLTTPDEQTGRPLLPDTVRNYRQTVALIFDEAVRLGLIQGNPVRSVDPPARQPSHKPTLVSDDVHRLLKGARGDRLGAAVAVLFVQGWRVSEALGLAWPDIDLETGEAMVRRVSVYRKGVGQVLKPQAKTDGAHGEHWLAPIVVEFLTERRELQEAERGIAARWHQPEMDGRPVDLVFTNLSGGLVLRHHVERAVARAAKAAGLDPAGLATHGGRRSVITALWSEGDEAIEDIARFIGHAKTSTTESYVKRLGRRPRGVAARAAALLDPTAKI